MKTFGFSWKRAVGITSAKRQIGKALCVPLTKSGREQAVGRFVLGLLGMGKKRKWK